MLVRFRKSDAATSLRESLQQLITVHMRLSPHRGNTAPRFLIKSDGDSGDADLFGLS